MTFATLQECETYIKVFETTGQTVPADWYQQRVALGGAPAPATPVIIKDIYPHLKAKFNYSVALQNCITDTVGKLINVPSGFDAKAPGLLLGKIQSGKTRAFVGIMALAFDKGFDICIVMTKGTRVLADQTFTRMSSDFYDFRDQGLLGQPVVNVVDILNIRNGLTQKELNAQKNIIICKKQKDNLNVLINILRQSPLMQSKKILVIDDEADFASRNYRVSNEMTDLAKIAKQIDEFVGIPGYCRYLQVTATPYSLYLQPDGCINLSNGVAMSFKPRFTTLLPIYPEYIGGEQYFVCSKDPDSMYSHLFGHMSEECRQRLSHPHQRVLNNVETSPSLQELRNAVLGYFVATAIRRIQKRNEGRDYKSSCVVHVEIARANHQWQGLLVDSLLTKWKSWFSDNTAQAQLGQAFDALYDDYCQSNAKGRAQGLISVAVPAKNEVWKEIETLFLQQDYIVSVINSDNDVQALLDSTSGQLKLTHSLNLFVGGQILDRGITIENLICFIYGRNPRQLQQDTVLQHARMYGNRSKEDMAVTRFYTTPRLLQLLESINDLDEQLRQWLAGNIKSPLANPADAVVFLGHSGDIRPCAANKIAVSDCVAIKPGRRILPYGFQTGCATAIKKTIDSIVADLSATKYPNRDADGIFEMDAAEAIRLIRLIRSTYIYDRPADDNADLEWNVNDMIGAIKYATSYTGGKMYAWHIEHRNLSRVRPNGVLQDSPDGRDLIVARAKAQDLPIIMFIHEEGVDEKGESNGWRDTPFYWPVLVIQKNVHPVIFTPSEI